MTDSLIVEKCPNCQTVGFFKCPSCHTEWYDRTQSLASSYERLAPKVRELQKQVAELTGVLKMLRIVRKPEMNVVWVHGEAAAAHEIERLLGENQQ